MNKKISIIVPVYNTSLYLKECLESIANQNYKNIEVICIDDGSTDDSVDIIKIFVEKDNRFKLIQNQHEGIAHTRNTGIANATGDFITFIDSDDTIEPDTYKEALKYIEKVDFVCFKIKIFGDNYCKRRKIESKYYNFKFKGIENLNNNILKNLDTSLCNKIFKTKIIREQKIYFPEGLIYEDTNFYWKYMLNSRKGYFIPKYYYNYRRRENSIMTNSIEKKAKSIDHLLILEDLFIYLDNSNLFLKNIKLCAHLLENYYRFVVRLSKIEDYEQIFELTYKYALFIQEKGYNNTFIKDVLKKDYNKTMCSNFRLIEKIFSIKNDIRKEYKIITILGLQIRIKK